MMNILEKFIAQVQARSAENKKSFELLYKHECYGVCIGIIRQELDSLQRVSYLIDWDNGCQFRQNAFDLVSNNVQIGEWGFINANGKKQKVRDIDMLQTGGWEAVVYNFGCGLVHLTDKHLYRDFDPVVKMRDEEKQLTIEYLEKYHGFDKLEVDMNDIIQYLPKIYKKIYENIEYNLEEIISINSMTKIFD